MTKSITVTTVTIVGDQWLNHNNPEHVAKLKELEMIRKVKALVLFRGLKTPPADMNELIDAALNEDSWWDTIHGCVFENKNRLGVYRKIFGKITHKSYTEATAKDICNASMSCNKYLPLGIRWGWDQDPKTGEIIYNNNTNKLSLFKPSVVIENEKTISDEEMAKSVFGEGYLETKLRR